jgi:putative transposase
MEIVRTIKLKLNIPVESILSSITEYTSAYNFVCSVGWTDKDCNGTSLHKKTYEYCRSSFNLPSQLAISARMRAAESLRSALTAQKKLEKQKSFKKTKPKKEKIISCPASRQLAIRLDARSYTLRLDKGEVSLLTINGRIKTKIDVPEYFHQYLNWKSCSADLFIKNDRVYLAVSMKTIIEEIPVNDKVTGIDRGLNKLAVTSDNKFYGGGHVRKISKRYKEIRQKLQSKGTASAKRHLNRLSGREQRFKTDVNHCISKSIVKFVDSGSTLVLESLKNIRKKVKLRKKQRTELNSWAFFQLEKFIEYKAAVQNIKVVYVSPRYTSQRCSKCGHIAKTNRLSQCLFKCKQCSFQLNADLNASRNIRDKLSDSTSYPERASVNEPIVAISDNELQA